jgi:hypothetical protein
MISSHRACREHREDNGLFSGVAGNKKGFNSVNSVRGKRPESGGLKNVDKNMAKRCGHH